MIWRIRSFLLIGLRSLETEVNGTEADSVARLGATLAGGTSLGEGMTLDMRALPCCVLKKGLPNVA